jgi:hypothetical protein
MNKNMGSADRIIRLVIVIAIAVLYFTNTISGTLAIILGIIAIIFLLTVLLGWCPTYLPFGLSTRGSSGAAPPAPEPSPPPMQEAAPPAEEPAPTEEHMHEEESPEPEAPRTSEFGEE